MTLALARASAAATALKCWLLGGPAQVSAGPEAGAIAGTLDAAGEAHYVYGEITGYYLHWLAAQVPDDRKAIENARTALQWVTHRYGGAALPPTRIYLSDRPEDWRNRTQFCFDLAMLAGGLAMAPSRCLVPVPDGGWSRLLHRP